mmetsp:Transcript_48890/g.103960  ORF Transcript_48890/g.103960 Transcript_48890/m.103960 type:complete len:117 (+) Transcript_48890:1267-1617(+)
MRHGAPDDRASSLQRYYPNNFIDADRREGADLLAGSTGFDTLPSADVGIDDGDDVTASSAPLFAPRELANDKTHARIKVESSSAFLLQVVSLVDDGGEVTAHLQLTSRADSCQKEQ